MPGIGLPAQVVGARKILPMQKRRGIKRKKVILAVLKCLSSDPDVILVIKNILAVLNSSSWTPDVVLITAKIMQSNAERKRHDSPNDVFQPPSQPHCAGTK